MKTFFLWYAIGYVLSYIVGRLMERYHAGEKSWTVADRREALQVSLLSWVIVVIALFVLIDCYTKRIKNPFAPKNPDRPAKW